MGILAGFWLRNGAFWARFAALWGVSDACASLFRQGLGGGSLTGGAWVRGEGGGRSCTLGRSGAQGAVRKSFRFIRAALRVICFLFAWEVRALSLSLSLAPSCSLSSGYARPALPAATSLRAQLCVRKWPQGGRAAHTPMDPFC